MAVTSYEKRVLCDNCGRWVSRTRVDAATFERLVRQQDPDEEDLFEEEYEHPVAVVVTHVPVCGHCQEAT
ncbi:MAG TPA: hypothetical protein VFB38_09810 [Chthonomonadaceae bacterium]|nr:hypothetical protein [Chthonomonadaceae bacterium]